MSSKRSSTSPGQRVKRDDIQGLRAIAIIAVLIFHIWPDYFVRGFLGVDIFFVLSGYLMAMILSAYGAINLSTTAEFYFRRLKRIVPIFLLVVAAVLAASVWIVRPADYAQITHDALPAVSFVSNMADILEEADYFDAVTKSRYFLHSWSLAVEVQFYVLVPLLFWFLFAVPRRIIYIPCLIFAATSLALQASSAEKVAFGFLFCRIWQFMTGIVAFFVVDAMNADGYTSIPNDQDDTAESQLEQTTNALPDEGESSFARIIKDTMGGTMSFVSTFVLLAFLAVPVQLSDLMCRIAVVVLSGCLLVCGAWQQNVLLNNRVSVWIGDASYTLYLVHWPVVVFLKYLSIETHFSLIEGVEIVTISFGLAAVLHHYVDAHFRVISSKVQLFKVTLLLYLAVFAIYGSLVYLTPNKTYKKADIRHFRNTLRDLTDPNTRSAALATMDLKTKIGLNAAMWDMRKKCPNEKFVFHERINVTTKLRRWECTWKGNGSKTALMIGNSHAMMAAEGIGKALEGTFSTLRFLGLAGCSAFRSVNSTSGDAACDMFPQIAKEMIRETKPNILFFIYMYKTSGDPAINGSLDADPLLAAIRDVVREASAFAETIYFADPMIEWPTEVSKVLGRRLQRNQSIENTRVTTKDYEKMFANNLQRLDHLDCPRCVRIRWEEMFCDHKTEMCSPYDPDCQVAYFRDTHHLSIYGNYKLASYLRSLRVSARPT